MDSAITRDQARANIQEEVEDDDRDKYLNIANGSLESIEIDGRRSFYRLRSTWSTVIILWITILIFFNIELSHMIGSAQWSFLEYEWFITAVTVETFLQIVGLGYVAAKFLFSKI